MILKAIINYYQSHQQTILEFHDGVNVIIGSSDSGKSALLRAIRWVITNKPGGNKFRSNFAEEKTITSVKLYLSTGDVIIRRIKKGKNQYVVNGKVLKAFSRNIPEEVSKLLNFSDINLQLQLDNPFLLTETAGNVAKHFNKVANLDKIDEATSNIKKEVTRINTSIKVQKEKLEEEQEKLKSFPNVEQIDLDLEHLERKGKLLIKNLQDVTKINLLLVDYNENKQKIIEAENLLQHESKIDEILSLIYEKENKTIATENLKSLVDIFETNEKTIVENEDFLQSESIVTNLLAKIALLNKNKALVTTLNTLTVTYKANKLKAVKLKEKALELEKIFHDELDVCPLCGTELKKINK